MTDDLNPTAGARYLLERVEDRGATATYRVAIHTPEATFASTATLSEDGTFVVAPTGAPAELEARLAMFAKLTARGAAKRREDGLPAWPARVLRWR